MSIFDEKTDRRHTGSMKWDVTEKELPMWVADMDFQTAPQITEAIIKRAQHGVFGYTLIDVVAHSVTGVTNELTEKIEKLPIKEQKKIIKVIHTLLEE